MTPFDSALTDADRIARTLLDAVNGENAISALLAMHAAAAHLEANLTGFEDLGRERVIRACQREGRAFEIVDRTTVTPRLQR